MSERFTRRDVRPLARYVAVVLSSGDVVLFLLLVSLLVPAVGGTADVWAEEWIAAALALAYFLALQVIMIPIIVWMYRF